MKSCYLFLLFSYFSFNQYTQAIVDLNNNQVSDIWEQKYNAASLVQDQASQSADTDNDGYTNLQEANAGTDPRSFTSRPLIKILSKNGDNVSLQYTTEIGKKYQVFSTSTLNNPSTWNGYDLPEIANANTETKNIPNQTSNHSFYRIKITDADSDNDGITDWEEQNLDGFDPQNAFSFGNGVNDADAIAELQAQLTNTNIAASAAEAYEKDLSPSSFTITRPTNSAYPLTVYYHLTGSTDPTKSSASNDDYILKNAANEVLSKKYISIPVGNNSVEIFVHPAPDNKIEVPETLVCNISNTSKNASTKINDAKNTDENRRLFVARLKPVAGTNSTGSGIASMLLRGDNKLGFITINFSGLEGTQTGAHIQYSNINTQTNLESLAGGQFTNYAYGLFASEFLNTDQKILDALLAGKILINVESNKNINGDIRGPFLQSIGSETFVAPAQPPAIETLTGFDLDRDIIRFLTQSTFGATPQSYNQLKAMVTAKGGDRLAAFSEYIDMNFGLNAQTSIPSPSLEVMTYAADAQENYLASIAGSPDFDPEYDHRRNNRRRCWWTMTQAAQDQIRQRAAFALSEIFVVSGGDNVIDNRQYGMANYYDMLKNSTSGTYRDLLENVSKHPIMGQYLSSLRNAKSDGLIAPDENYAREIMQLFSIGLVHLHEDGSLKLSPEGIPIPTYNQSDISEMARVFTGWSFSLRNSPNDSPNIIPNTNFNYGAGKSFTYQDQWTNPMINFAEFHDKGTKEMTTLGLSINAGNTGEQELDKVLDYLGKYNSSTPPFSNHQTTPPFIIRRLIQRFVTSNPSNGYIYRITQTWKNTNGHIGEVIKAILLDYEARSLQPTLAASYGKKKEPIIHISAFMRALSTKSQLPITDLADTTNLTPHTYSAPKYSRITAEVAKFPPGTTRFRMPNTDASIGQTPLQAPTVFNYFLPDYSPAGTLSTNGLNAPEFQLATEVGVINHINALHTLFNTNGRSGSEVPNQNEPNPAHNPYNYGQYADHMLPDRNPSSSHFIKKYLAIMDTNLDGKVNNLDSSFDQPVFIYAAVAALVDELDLFLSAGKIKSRFAAGYNYTAARPNNPRDQIIEAVARSYYYYDDDGESNPANANYSRDEGRQITILQQRLRYAAYLIASSPYGMIQR